MCGNGLFVQSTMDDRLWVSKDVLCVATGCLCRVQWMTDYGFLKMYCVWQRVVCAEYNG